MADYIVEVNLTVKVPVSAPNGDQAISLALRQLTVKLGREATDGALAMTYQKGK